MWHRKKTTRRTHCAGVDHRKLKLRVETLEDRCLLSASPAAQPLGDVSIQSDAYVVKDPNHYVGRFGLKPGGKGVTTLLDGVNDGFAPIPLGAHTFKFYDTTYTGDGQLFVSTNGLITFGSGVASAGNSGLTADPLPATIAVLWDDWTTDMADGKKNDAVLYKFTKVSGYQLLVIEWNDVRRAGDSPDERATFQAVLLLDGSENGSITLQYSDLKLEESVGDKGASATVGIKAAGVQGPDRLPLAQDATDNPWLDDGKKENSVIYVPAPEESSQPHQATVHSRIGLPNPGDLLDLPTDGRTPRRLRG